MTDDEREILRLDNQICFPLYAAARLTVQAYRPLLGELGLTYPQYLVLMVLWEHDGLSVGDLGARLHLNSATLTPVLKRLQRQGLVRRQRRPSDDRTVENWLTDAGRALQERAVSVPTRLICNAALEMDELIALKNALQPVLDKLLAHVRVDAGGEPVESIETGETSLDQTGDRDL
ncbi:MAG: MarR family transcriptional regulator [Kofleriaceae bacterium]|nr:MarR family transcriptional regulator [Myxococcales bacterium]MCB9564778.1 MarR family transcriptional regulator [Kofleriaceae bacterium]MCB9572827.1 MarR family transcriptional regulator [Kofleriaceae bacterium]